MCCIYAQRTCSDSIVHGEKIVHAQNRVNYLIKVFLRPVYQAVGQALDILGSTRISEGFVESDFKTLVEYTNIICDDVIKRSRNRGIKFTEFPDLQIQSEIEKIIDNDEKENEEKLYKVITDRSVSTLTTGSQSNRIILRPLISKISSIKDEEISCFTPILTPLLTRFSSIVKPLSGYSEDILLDEEPLVSNLML